MLLWPHPINIKSKTKKRIRVSPGNLIASKTKGQECFFEIQTLQAPNKVKPILSAMQPNYQQETTTQNEEKNQSIKQADKQQR